MVKIDPYIEREFTENTQILYYQAASVMPSSLMQWTDDLFGLLVEQRGPSHIRLLYDISDPRSSMSYMILTEHDFLHPGITRTGKVRLEQLLKQRPEMIIHFALLVSNTISDQTIYRYNANGANVHPQVTAQVFQEQDEAVQWLTQTMQDEVMTNPLTRPIDRAWVKAVGDHFADNDETYYGDQDEISFLVGDRVVTLAFPANKTIIIGRNVAGRQNAVIHLNLSIHQNSLSVSRQHARIDLRGGHLYVTDLHSTNGTAVNGEVINPGTPRLIGNTDVIQLGEVRLSVMFE